MVLTANAKCAWIPELTTECQIRSWRKRRCCDFHKGHPGFSGWNEKPQTNFDILENTISTNHELNLNRFWVIPHGKIDNWKFATKYDIWLLKYWWFLKAFRELQFKWNSPVLDLNYTESFLYKFIKLIEACFLLRFSWAKSICQFRALISTILRLPTLVSVFANFLG